MAEVTISRHALAQLPYRGATAAEVVEAVNTSGWFSAGRGRLDCRKDYPFEGEWLGRRYAWKQVRPIFIEDAAGVTVVTVYTYFSETEPQ